MPSVERPADSLRLYARALQRHWPLALAIVVVAALAGYAVARTSPRTYGATAKVLLDQQKPVDVLLGAGGYSTDPERELNTGVMLVTLEPVAAIVRDTLGLPETPAALAAKVSVAADSNSNIVSITARDASARRAARIADGFAVAYRGYRARAAQASVGDAITSARRRLGALPAGSAEATALQAELQRLQVAAAVRTGGVQIVRPAAGSGVSVEPRPLVSAFVGGSLGLVLAGLAIVLLARTDRRVRDRGALEAVAGKPVVALVPQHEPAARDALMTLAVSLQRTGDAPTVLLLTSAGPGEGTPEVALGLAAAVAMLGRTSIVVETDLRTPEFAAQLGLDRPAGLGAVLRGESSLELELDLVEVAATPGAGGAGAWALPAGAPAPLPQVLLAGERMEALVQAARELADVVILAGAPAGTAGDVLPLAALADRVLLVTRLGATEADRVRDAMRALDGVGAAPEGVVATTPPPRWRGLAGLGIGARRRTPHGETTRAPGAGGTQEVTAG
jgi:Mrp family chromosome partitioning ATPase